MEKMRPEVAIFPVHGLAVNSEIRPARWLISSQGTMEVMSSHSFKP